MTIELILADPHPVMLEGLERLFHDAPGFHVRSMVIDGLSAWHEVQRQQPHVLIHELDMAGKDGPGLIRAIREHGLPTLPVVFTSVTGTRVREAGPRGLVSKRRPGQALVECVRAVMAGKTWLDPTLTPEEEVTPHAMPDNWHGMLTAREQGVARLVVEGLSNKRIASRLNITEGTTKLHLHHIYQKLQCPGRMALMVLMRDGVLR